MEHLDLAEREVLGVGHEGGRASEHLEEHAAQRPHVGAAGGVFIVEHLPVRVRVRVGARVRARVRVRVRVASSSLSTSGETYCAVPTKRAWSGLGL